MDGTIPGDKCLRKGCERCHAVAASHQEAAVTLGQVEPLAQRTADPHPVTGREIAKGLGGLTHPLDGDARPPPDVR